MMDTQWSTTRLRDAQPDLAIRPVAAIERHGPHLPIGTDWLVREAIAGRVAAAFAESLRGGLIPAAPVPFDAAGRIDWAAQERYVERMAEPSLRSTSGLLPGRAGAG